MHRLAASRTVALGGTVATVGFPDIGLQGFAPKAGPDLTQRRKAAKDRNANHCLCFCALAPLRLCVEFFQRGHLPENVNYAVKSSLLLASWSRCRMWMQKLKVPVTADRKFEDVVKSAQDAAVLVLVY